MYNSILKLESLQVHNLAKTACTWARINSWVGDKPDTTDNRTQHKQQLTTTMEHHFFDSNAYNQPHGPDGDGPDLDTKFAEYNSKLQVTM